MATDQATADYEAEQAEREASQDDRWAQSEQPAYKPIPNGCSQCINWRPDRQLHLADGSSQSTPGFCSARAAADLPQIPQTYAQDCAFYVEEIPF